MNDAYHLIVLFGSLALMMFLVVRGKSIFVVAPLCALLAVTLSGADPLAKMNTAYMAGFANYVRDFYLIFALGAVFGKLMEESGAAVTVAHGVGKLLGKQRACLAVVLACAVLTYGGVSLFVVGFSVYPLAVLLFRAANLPRRFIPAALAFGSITFTMTSAGSPEVQNLIPIKLLANVKIVEAKVIDPRTGEVQTVKKEIIEKLTDARAGWPVSLIVSVMMFGLGQWYLDRVIRQAVARGEHFEARDQDRVSIHADSHGPSFKAAITPLVVTLLALNVLPGFCHGCDRWFVSPVDWPTLHAVLSQFPEDATLAIFLGVLSGVCVMRRQLPDVWSCFGQGFLNGFMAVGSTSAVVGFGAAVKDLPAFRLVIHAVTHLPFENPLISAAIAVAVIAGIAGSASGGQGIALPILKPIYIDELNVAPRALHRVVSIASGSLDSLPANGYLVMLIRNICGETHARSYGPIFVTTVLLPAAATALAIALFKWFPSWATM